MKKALLLAVVASMLVSANVTFAGFGVPSAPGAGKPAASSSQQKIDTAALKAQEEGVNAYVFDALQNMAKAHLELTSVVGVVDKATLETAKKISEKPNVKDGKNFTKSINNKRTYANFDKAAAKADQGKLAAAYKKSKEFYNAANTSAVAAITPAATLLQSASAALKSAGTDMTAMNQIKGIIDVCKFAPDYLKAMQSYDKQVSQIVKKYVPADMLK